MKEFGDWIAFPLSRAKLRKMEADLPVGAARLMVPFTFRGVGHYRKIAPMQAKVEIAALCQTVRELNPSVVVEIGTCFGGTLYLWGQMANPAATIVSMDLPGGKYGGGYAVAREKFYKLFAQKNQTMKLLRGNSHEEAMKAKLIEALGGREIDFLFIDGDHSYAGVKKDYEMYAPLVRAGGVIAFHDIVARKNAADGIEVDKFWAELKTTGVKTEEYINTDPNDRTIGIGVVRK